jgi:hypothetical protein
MNWKYCQLGNDAKFVLTMVSFQVCVIHWKESSSQIVADQLLTFDIEYA